MKTLTRNVIYAIVISISISCSETTKDPENESHSEVRHEKKHGKKHGLNEEHGKDHDQEHSNKDSHKDEEHSDEHGHQEETKFGDGKATTKADEKKGIQLANHVIELLKIETKPLRKYSSAKYDYRVPKSSLVYFEDNVAIYYKRENWYNLRNVKIRSERGSTVLIFTKHLRKTDHLVINGVPLLRLAHLEAFGASGEGHGH